MQLKQQKLKLNIHLIIKNATIAAITRTHTTTANTIYGTISKLKNAYTFLRLKYIFNFTKKQIQFNNIIRYFLE